MIKFVILTFILTFNSFSAVYDYFPESTMSLGKGFNPFKPTQQHQECFQHSGFEELDSGGAVSTDIVINLVKSYKDLYQYLKFSASAAVSYKVYSGSASVNFEEESLFHSDSLTWMILFRSDYGRKGIKSPTLKNEYQNYDAQKLYQACGSELVTSVKRGAMVYALLTVKNLNQKEREKLETNFKAKANGGFWGGKVKGHYQKIINSVLMANEVSIKIHTVGGDGIQRFKDLTKKEYIDYEKLPEVLNQYLGHLNKENSAPIQYTTTPLSSLTGIDAELVGFQSHNISEIYYQYQELQSKISRLYKILYGSDREKFEVSYPEILKNQYQQLISQQTIVWNAANNCLKAKDNICEIPNLEIQKISWPSQLKNYCENERRSALETGILSLEFYIMAKKRDLIPILEHLQIVGYQYCQ